MDPSEALHDLFVRAIGQREYGQWSVVRWQRAGQGSEFSVELRGPRVWGNCNRAGEKARPHADSREYFSQAGPEDREQYEF
jgi:hypothetical protein